MSHILHKVEIGNKGNTNIYYNSLGKNLLQIVTLTEKWSQTLNEEINTQMLHTAFKIAKNHSPSVYQHFLQYCIVLYGLLTVLNCTKSH